MYSTQISMLHFCTFVCLFGLILYVSVNIFSVMSGQVFLGLTRTKQSISILFKDTMQCLRCGPNMQPLDLESSTLQGSYRQDCVKIQGLLKASSTVFKD